MSKDIRTLLPRNKSDGENARAIIAEGYPAVEPVLAKLVEWLQDPNWPISKLLAPFLATIGAPMIPYVQHVLETNDAGWKYQVLQHIVAASPEIALAVKDELERMATTPNHDEKVEEVDVMAQSILNKLRTEN